MSNTSDNIIVGTNFEYQLTKKSSTFYKFFFRILEQGVDTGYELVVHLYGGISIPKAIKYQIPNEDRNRLSARAIKEFKSGYHF